MDIKTKHRIIGIIAIVALAVIFLPMLFTHSFNDTALKLSSHVPSAPDKPSLELNTPSAPPSPSSNSSNAPASVSTSATSNDNNNLATAPLQISNNTDSDKVDANIEQSNESNLSDALTTSVTASQSNPPINSVTTTTVKPAAEKNNVTQPQQLNSAEKPVASAHFMDLKKSIIKNAPAASQAEAWTIQIGSFSDKNNALQLVKKLRNKGFAAYSNEVKTGAVSMTRVFVGPELQREKAETILNQLQQQFGLKGVIAKYQV